MSDNEQDLNAQQQNLVTNTDPMQLILTMQQQQITMTEQMATLMSQLLPTSTRPTVSLDSPMGSCILPSEPCEPCKAMRVKQSAIG